MFENKKIGVFGLGLSGIATLKYLSKKEVDFIAFDDKEETIKKIIKDHPEFSKYLKDLADEAWGAIDYLILSPGISLTHPEPHKIVKLVKQRNIKIICDIEVLYLNNKDAFFIGITGTNGKSTTTSLIAHILKYNNVNVVLGGNIGIPVLSFDDISESEHDEGERKFVMLSDSETSRNNYTDWILRQVPQNDEKRDTVFVLEVSSFQLDLLDKTKFNIAVFLNITPDHLDRHGNMENYTNSKYKIFQNQSDDDHAIIHSSLKKVKNTTIFSEEDVKDIIIDNNSLLGQHNKQNLAAAIACCLKFGLQKEKIIEALPSFVGLKHRMQYLGEHNQIKFINDSKATNADSTEKALASFDNIIWIAGGVAKAGGIESLKKYFPKIKVALLIGDAQDEFAATCGHEVLWKKCDNLENAFAEACKIAKPGDIILLSPACASFDQWRNFEERGDAFIEMFNRISM